MRRGVIKVGENGNSIVSSKGSNGNGDGNGAKIKAGIKASNKDNYNTIVASSSGDDGESAMAAVVRKLKEECLLDTSDLDAVLIPKSSWVPTNYIDGEWVMQPSMMD